MSLIDQLRTLGEGVSSKLRYVNYGGCCVYAATVARALQELGIPVWGIAADNWVSDKINLNVVRATNKPKNHLEWNKAGVQFGHVLIQFVHRGEIWTHDSDNTRPGAVSRDPTCGLRVVEGYMTVPELEALASSEQGWNPTFDREVGIPVIKSEVDRLITFELVFGGASA
jgi:hypothetical protein